MKKKYSIFIYVCTLVYVINNYFIYYHLYLLPKNFDLIFSFLFIVLFKMLIDFIIINNKITTSEIILNYNIINVFISIFF
jgi:hypothetical protein